MHFERPYIRLLLSSSLSLHSHVQLQADIRTRPDQTFPLFQNLKILQSVNLMLFRNVDRRILRLGNCEMLERERECSFLVCQQMRLSIRYR